MKRRRADSECTDSKPVKILLHMALRNGGWCGVAVRVGSEERYFFRNIQDLAIWLEEQARFVAGDLIAE